MLDLSKIPLTESILQSCFKSKTYVRDGNWDILWYLGGKNDVTIGEKQGKFYLMPSESIETVTEVLPFELVQGLHIKGKSELYALQTVADLVLYFPEGSATVRDKMSL
ncbi:MAG: hypothetical protein K2L34_16040 [Muribaculaceae bacterium]|nr:hypothetical protein [Muribaculaceae bacterium]